jgi:very-short-patch-repair endonuclease/transcription elongation GreA/GreB family factor
MIDGSAEIGDPGHATGRLERGSLGDRAVRVFEFLIELQRLRTKVARTLDTYRSVLWFADLPDTEEVLAAHRTDDLDVWLAVERVERNNPPSPPTGLAAWISEAALRDSQQDRPALSPRTVRVIEVGTPDGTTTSATEELLLDDHPEVETLLDRWLPEWSKWATEDRQRVRVAEIYQRLYMIYQDAHALAETYELRLAFGYLTTRSGDQDVRRHLITARAAIELDLDSGRLIVRPAPDGWAPDLEQDMLDPVDTVPDEVRETILNTLAGPDSPWTHDPGGASGILRAWVNGLSGDARYLSSIEPHTPSGDAPPTVSFAPALILRERTRRSFIAACQQIVETLRAGAAVPTGVRQFVEITDGKVSANEREKWDADYGDAETYFPKPSNEDQRQIVARLADSQTVVVQGPPGTGKTHTIANLITDLLAHGQRVLITSTTTRALKVLKEKLPEEIRDLCVSVTDDAVKGQADLEQSVSTILAQSDEWNGTSAATDADRLRGQLAAARAKLGEALAQLRAIREQETYEYAPDVGDYQGTLQTIASRLAAEESELGWLGEVPTEQATITAADALRYLNLLRRATPELRGLAGVVPDLGQLPSPSDLSELLDRRAEIEHRGRDLAEIQDTPGYRALTSAGPDQRRALRDALSQFILRRDQLAHRRERWAAEAVADVLADRDRAWRQQHASTVNAIQTATELAPILGQHLVTGLTSIDLGIALGHASALSDHLRSGKKLTGMFGRTKVAKAAETFLEAVRVDGQRCDSMALLDIAQAQIALERTLLPIEQVWNLDDASTHPPAQRVARLQDEASTLGEVLAFADSHATLGQVVRFIRDLPALNPADPRHIDALRRSLDAAELTALRQQIEATVHPAWRLLSDTALDPRCVEAVSLAAQAINDWNAEAYTAAFGDLSAARDANGLLAELDAVQKMVTAAAPSLSAAIGATSSDPEWDRRLPRLEEAWAWRTWDAYIRDVTDPSAEQSWREQLATAEFDEREALKALASNLGWTHCLNRLTPTESSHLAMYALAVRKAGKGTGKHAARYQADARASLRQCQTAVPAWIMPMHQVFETIPVDQPNLFDVVIIDEASQSGLEALLLSWVAPRLVVVGDDKQVSPSNVGMNHDAVFTLQDRYLTGMETKSLFGPMSSFFDQAVGMSPSRIMLREHFRCMPEIIGFSNELSYRGQLIPLRQYGADRLPPLRTTYIKGAMVAGRRDVVNEAEAATIVDQIAKCCADPAYDGRTMGVITLLGNAQDKLITQRLVDILGVREVQERKLFAGNAEAFQGDERHIMFISMVSSLQSTTGPARIGPLSKESDQQRFNVAASRAQDQLWLFHSVHPGDLSSKDLRRRYLQYLLKPSKDQDALDIGEVSPTDRHPSFDSLFEQRVYLAIRSRGYRVRPQLKAGRYRIDLVVEGGTQRLAVECDGDAFHGTEAEMDDAARQRDLERMGWTFCRVRGSTFFRDPESALDPLWALLDKLGIETVMRDGPPTEPVWQEVQASAAPLDRADLDVVDAILDASTPASAILTAIPHTTPDPATLAEPQLRANPTAITPRFRNGKMLLTAAARARIQHEVEDIQEWLRNPPTPTGVDARSLDVQRAKQAKHRDDLEERLDFLRRVTAQSIADPTHAGGQWVTPGSLIGLRFNDSEDIERCVVTTIHSDEFEQISPFTELGRIIDGAELGATVHYQSPTGATSVTVVEVAD